MSLTRPDPMLPDLPLLTLNHGEWRAEILDPRADPYALGPRYVHGGYVAQWWKGDRQLTGAVRPAWSAFNGVGLPETFEASLGFADAEIGDEIVRVGAGRMRKTAPFDTTDQQIRGRLTAAAVWTVEEHTSERLVMAGQDYRDYGPDHISWRMLRTITLGAGTLASTTDLELSFPGREHVLVSWYAHPFLAQGAIDGTGLILPAQAVIPPRSRRGQAIEPGMVLTDGVWRMRQVFGRRTVFTGIWSSREPFGLLLDPKLGGGRLSIALDRPLDHAVVFATEDCFSPEPKLARMWQDQERASWTISYRYQE